MARYCSGGEKRGPPTANAAAATVAKAHPASTVLARPTSDIVPTSAVDLPQSPPQSDGAN
jgi:hypothetical protein